MWYKTCAVIPRAEAQEFISSYFAAYSGISYYMMAIKEQAKSQGFVETSNVNVVEELVQMIQTQRAYELNSKAIQTSDQMLQKLAQL